MTTNPDFDAQVAAGVRRCIERLKEGDAVTAKFSIFDEGGYIVTVSRLSPMKNEEKKSA